MEKLVIELIKYNTTSDPIICNSAGCYYPKKCSEVTNPSVIVTTKFYDTNSEYKLQISNNKMLVNGSDIGL